MKKKSGRYYHVPSTANLTIADRQVTYQELNEVISNLSFDAPGAVVNYSIEVCPQTDSVKKFRTEDAF